MSDLPEQWIAFEENLGHWNSGLIFQGDTWMLKIILRFANGYGTFASDLFKPSSVTIVSIMSYHKRCISLPYFVFEWNLVLVTIAFVIQLISIIFYMDQFYFLLIDP